jgi:hypothetical protein
LVRAVAARRQQLGPLADNGGPTETRLRLAGSAVLDRIPVGTSGLCTAGIADQRGVSRAAGPAGDEGAVESTTAVP